MASGVEPKRRRLVYLDEGNPLDVPKSTLAHYRVAAPSGNSVNSKVCDPPTGVHASVPVYCASDSPVSSVMCEAPVSGSNLGKEDQEQVSSASPETRETFSDDSSVDDFIVDGNEYTPGDVDTSSEGSNFYDLPQPDAMSEEDFLAAGLQQFGSETLPHSTTTKAEALAMMMSFLSANGLSWKALDDLLKMSNTFFAPVSDVFPRSKYLFRKMWASKTVELVDYHY